MAMKMSLAVTPSLSLKAAHLVESTTKKFRATFTVRQVAASKSLGKRSVRPHAKEPATQLLSENDHSGLPVFRPDGDVPWSSNPQSCLLPSKRRNSVILARPSVVPSGRLIWAPVMSVVGTPTPRSFLTSPLMGGYIVP